MSEQAFGLGTLPEEMAQVHIAALEERVKDLEAELVQYREEPDENHTGTLKSKIKATSKVDNYNNGEGILT